MDVGTIAELWRYPVKSMVGEQLTGTAMDLRGLHADRMWAVRDLELGAVTTARRLPALLGCTARFLQEPPAGVGPGDVCDVRVTFPDGTEVTTLDRERLDARLSELVGKPLAMVPLPDVHDRAAYRGVLANKSDLRRQWDLTADEPLPDLSMFPIRKLAELAVHATPIGIFADAYAVHVLTTSSLRTIAADAGDVDVRRFRPNVLLDTEADGLLEQDWLGGSLRTGEARLRLEIPTIRCSIPTRAQAGLAPNPEVSRSISRHGDRSLGVYADIVSAGTLRVGAPVSFEPAPERGAVAAAIGRMGERVRRKTIRTGNRLLPGGR